jgi:hypothetical protein
MNQDNLESFKQLLPQTTEGDLERGTERSKKERFSS